MLFVRRTFLFAVLMCAMLSACQLKQKSAVSSGKSVPFRYACLLQMERSEGYVVCRIADAWHTGKTLRTYVLLTDTTHLPDRLPAGTVVKVPLRRAVAGSSVHAALAYELGAGGQLAGMCDANFVVRKDLRQALADGRLRDMGSGVQPDAERMLHNGIDGVLISPYENAQYGPIAQTGIPLIECADYMETTALGRAEWMKFYGLLFGCPEQADSLFAEVERNYLALCRKAARATSRPRVLVDCQVGGTWYVPGGSSTIGTLLRDAGADYLIADNTASGSLPYNFEQVYARGADADVWIIRYGSASNLTRAQLGRDFAPNRRLRPWRENRIYLCNVSLRPYYEDTAFFPDRQLRDLVQIFHPELAAGTMLQYYEKME